MNAPQAQDAPLVLTASGRLTWHVGAVAADVVVTVAAGDPAVLARRLDRALAAFAHYGAALDVEPPPPPVCATHGQPLTWRTPKDGGPGWWSHRTHDGGWCRG